MENQNDYREYDTIMIKLSNGKEQEFAIMDEFELEKKHYIAVSLVQNDEILEGYYLYRVHESEEGLAVERIENAREMERVTAFFSGRE